MKRKLKVAVAVLTIASVGGVSTFAQCTTEWPLSNGTPEQTRFSDISYPAPGQGILWRDPFCVGEYYASTPVLADGVVIFGTSGPGSQSGGTRFVDARTGRLRYVITLPGLGTRQAVGKVLLGDGSLLTLAFLATIVPTSVTGQYTLMVSAYDLDQLPASPADPWAPVWSREDLTISSGIDVNFAEDCGDSQAAFFLVGRQGPSGDALYKFAAADGELLWTMPIGNSQGTLAIGEVDSETGKRKVVITAGLNGVMATGATDGSLVWKQARYEAKDPTFVTAPGGLHRVLASVWIPTGGKKPSTRPGLVCLDADRNGDIIPPWPITLYQDSWQNPANGPASVRYAPTSDGAYDVAIYHTPGSHSPQQENDQPLWAFKLDGTSAWPDGLPNPILLPCGTWNETMITQDRLMLPLFNGDLFSVDLTSGQVDTAPLELCYYGGRAMAVDFGDGSDPVYYSYSLRLGLLAIVPKPVHNLSLTSCSLTETVQGGQPVTISGTVENLGNYLEDTEVVLEVDGGAPESIPIRVAPKATGAFSFDWTPAISSGPYTVPVRVCVMPHPDEVGIYDNDVSKMVTVLPTDVVTVTAAYWIQSKKKLQVEATSSTPGQAVLYVYYPDKATDGTPGKMNHSPSTDTYSYFGNEQSYYSTVYVESSLGGSATFSKVGLRPR